jgi:uncharacterized protein YndB with AHSA1/START domain
LNEGHTLRIERTYQAPAQAVFDAWTSEEVLRRWFHARHDWETTEAKVDLRVGGDVRVVMRDPTTTSSTAAAASTPRSSPETPGVHLDLGRRRQATADRARLRGDRRDHDVRFIHSGLWDKESVRLHEDGWGKCFDNLERTLQAAQPGR